MKKKQRCFVKRFAALVAAMMLCASLCFPAFASNNASTKKWVVVAEDQRRGENGVLTRYLKVSPYENGSLYAATFTTQFLSVVANPASSGLKIYDTWATPVNYPDWWRADLPLGRTAYVEFDSVTFVAGSWPSGSSVSTILFLPVNSQYSFDVTVSKYSSANAITSVAPCYPVRVSTFYDGSYTDRTSSGFTVELGNSLIGPFSDKSQLVLSASNEGGFDFLSVDTFGNLSSDDLAWIVLPGNLFSISSNNYLGGYLSVSAVVSFWIDANKLPSGLKIGDEFPADTDAFDKLRDDLIDQFPEASDNIKNGKDTIQGWNDTETVDADVASTSISALNAMFQNLGGFLFIVSLMVFGAVVLRMLIRKAVDG